MINEAAAGEISKLKQKIVELTHSSTADKAILKAEVDKLRKLLQDEKEKVSPPLQICQDEILICEQLSNL
jgi:hypothetical protein